MLLDRFARWASVLDGFPVVGGGAVEVAWGVAAGASALAFEEPGEREVLLGVGPGQELVVSDGSAVSVAEVELDGEAGVRADAVTEKGMVDPCALTACAVPYRR